jgi:hypothetical protein
MLNRRWVVGCALLSVALLLALGVPHGHPRNGSLSRDDCVLCHTHHSPILESLPVGELPELVEGRPCPPAPAAGERVAAVRNHPSRAPPA